MRKRGYLYRYAELAQKVLGALLDKYANEGIRDIEDTKVLQLKEFAEYGSPMKIAKILGEKKVTSKLSWNLRTRFSAHKEKGKPKNGGYSEQWR